MNNPAIYSSRMVYRLLMRFLYRGGGYGDRYRMIAERVSSGARVLEVCCGDCYLFEHYLRAKSVMYTGLDISEPFVRAAKQNGIDARVFNVWLDELPRSQVVIMQASLYQFIMDARRIMNRLLDAAEERLIVAEPIKTLSTSHNRLVSGLSRFLTQPAGAPAGYNGDRFDKAELLKLFEESPCLEETVLLPGGAEMIGVFEKKCLANREPKREPRGC